jgi:hypothetical protein
MLWEFPRLHVISLSFQTAEAHTTPPSLDCILALTDPLLVWFHARGNDGFFLV